MWAIICSEKNNFFKKLSRSELLQSEAVLQEFKILFFSLQMMPHINQHILQKYAIKTKQTYQQLDGVSKSYIQNKHSTVQRLNAVLTY